MKQLHSFYLVIFLLSFTVINTVKAQSDPWVWIKTYGGSGREGIGKIVADAHGNIYANGGFTSPTLVMGNDTLTNTGTSNFFLVKYAPQGNVTWTRQSFTTGRVSIADMTVDSLGNMLITGTYTNAPLTLGDTTLEWGSMFVAKYSSDGNLLWVLGGSGEPGCIKADAAGNVFITGTFYASSINVGGTSVNPISPGYNSFIAKINTSGGVVWAKSTSGNGYSAFCIDHTGNIYLAINSWGYSVYVNNTSTQIVNPGDNSLNNNIYVLKLGSDGSYIWGKSFGGTDSDNAYNMLADDAGNFYMQGTFYGGTIRFGNYVITENIGTHRTFLVKFNAGGDVLWATSPEGTASFLGLVMDEEKNLLLPGSFMSATLALNADIVLHNRTGQYKDEHFFVKYDTLGNAKWWLTLPGSTRMYAAIQPAGNGYLYIGGEYADSLLLGDSMLYTVSQSSGYDILLAKLDEVPTPNITGIANQCAGQQQPVRAKLLNPPVSTYSTSIEIDGAPVPYNAADSSFLYFTDTTSVGPHHVVVRYARGTAFCSTDTVFTVKPPVVINAGRDTALCEPDTIRLGVPAIVGNTYLWVSNPPNGSTMQANPFAVPTFPVLYTLYQSNGGCTATDSIFIDIANKWTGTISSEWENPANWSCGIVPGPNTQVYIDSGTVVVHSNVFIWSLRLAPAVVFTVNPGYTFTILH